MRKDSANNVSRAVHSCKTSVADILSCNYSLYQKEHIENLAFCEKLLSLKFFFPEIHHISFYSLLGDNNTVFLGTTDRDLSKERLLTLPMKQ